MVKEESSSRTAGFDRRRLHRPRSPSPSRDRRNGRSYRYSNKRAASPSESPSKRVRIRSKSRSVGARDSYFDADRHDDFVDEHWHSSHYRESPTGRQRPPKLRDVGGIKQGCKPRGSFEPHLNFSNQQCRDAKVSEESKGVHWDSQHVPRQRASGRGDLAIQPADINHNGQFYQGSQRNDSVVHCCQRMRADRGVT